VRDSSSIIYNTTSPNCILWRSKVVRGAVAGRGSQDNNHVTYGRKWRHTQYNILTWYYIRNIVYIGNFSYSLRSDILAWYANQEKFDHKFG
jgi:hypothetical protein